MPEPGPPHLSIGEVLGLLLEEFPDVTISKIRFLESQGLIEPERTPSGYRKFFDDDVELLRAILRAQRENFLPLRVIKDRIDSGQLDPTPPRGQAGRAPRPAVDEDALAREIAIHPAAGRSGPPGTGAEDPPAEAAAPPAAPSPPPADPPSSASAATASLLPGVLLNREELCAMAGVTPAELGQLEEYGVVAKRTNATELYGEEVVEVATAAVGFLRSGVDARHLRGWRTSVEREAGLFEQLVLPLMRHRNPQARGQVSAKLAELDGLSVRLRAAMMRSALRRYVEQ
jgi:DNA-binding transcriptional MerR regulator